MNAIVALCQSLTLRRLYPKALSRQNPETRAYRDGWNDALRKVASIAADWAVTPTETDAASGAESQSAGTDLIGESVA